MKNAKIKKALAAGLSVALVAGLAVAGTVSYLQDTSEDAINTFSTNNVNVDLEETTGGSYNIIPGTSETKDPTVTVNASLPAYVYVEVTDETQGLVTYDIADGWTKLDGVANVYYREFTPSEDGEGNPVTTAEYSVLKDDQVSYSADLTNEDMLGKTNVKLSFVASAIQKAPFNDPVNAYFQTDTIEMLEVGENENVEEVIESINETIAEATSPVVIVVPESVETTTSINIPENKSVTLSLDNDTTLTNTSSHTVTIADGGALTVKGGTIDATAHATASVYNNNGTVVLDNVTLIRSEENGQDAYHNGGNSYYVVLNHGTMTLNNCTVEADGKYSSLIENGWQDGTKNTSGEVSTLTINGGTYTGGLNTVKNDDYGVLIINDGVFTNTAQYAVQNFNVATINGGTFKSDSYTVWNCYADATMDKGQITITGGNFQSGSYYCIYNSTSYSTTKGVVSVSGGTFTAKSKITNKSSYLADGYEAVKNEDGSYTVVVAAQSND